MTDSKRVITPEKSREDTTRSYRVRAFVCARSIAFSKPNLLLSGRSCCVRAPQVITLDNELQAALCSDPETDKVRRVAPVAPGIPGRAPMRAGRVRAGRARRASQRPGGRAGSGSLSRAHVLHGDGEIQGSMSRAIRAVYQSLRCAAG